MTRLADAVVLLTGAAGGIGAATTRALLDRGARVIGVDRDADGLAKLAGPGFTGRTADLRDRGGFADLVADVLGIHGRIDVLVNNAGLTVHGRFAGMDADAVDSVLDVNLLAPIHLTRCVLPHLARGGHIVNVSSMAGLRAFPTQSTYSASKFGLKGFGDALRIELAEEGIGVSTVLPGAIATRFLANAQSAEPDTTGTLSGLMLRFGTSPDRVARAIVRGIERNRGTLRVGWDCWALSAADWICPPLVPFILRQVQARKLLGDM